MRKLLKSYQKKLTNLTRNNKSLLLLRLSPLQDFDLQELDFLNNKPAFDIIEQLIGQKNRVGLCPVTDSRSKPINEASRKLRKLERYEKLIFEERGTRDLYVGWPFVKGQLADGTLVRCPLMFIPVTLHQESNQWYLIPNENTSITLNKSFLLAYSYYNEIPISDELLDASFEEVDTDIQIFRTHIYQLLKESPLEINFNQDLFINKLLPFYNYKKADYEELVKEGGLKLYSEAVLGIFPQAGNHLYNDFELLLENHCFTDLEEFFLQRTNGSQQKEAFFKKIQQIKEEQTFTPFQSDASQEQVIKAVKTGNSLVIQGPPGTGKSQVICNIITDFIARGKKVLLVCQKKAALDVVYERFKKIGLEDFLCVVNDYRNDRNPIFEKINKQIDRLNEYKQRNSNLDSIYLERKFVNSSRQIDQITEELEEFKKALFDRTDCGLSVKELYLTSSHEVPTINAKQEYKYFTEEELSSFPSKIKKWYSYAINFRRQDFIWKDRVSFKEFTAQDKKKVLQMLEEIPKFQSEVAEQIREIISVSLDLEECEWILEKEEKIKQMLVLLEDSISYANFVFLLNKNADLDNLHICEKRITECFKGPGLEESLLKEQLGTFQEALEKAYQARMKLHKWIWWKLVSKDTFFVKRTFVNNQLKLNKEGFNILMQKVDNRLNLEHNLSFLKNSEWFEKVPDKFNLQEIQEWFYYQFNALEARNLLQDLRLLKGVLDIPSLTKKELKEKLFALIEVIRPVPEKRRSWLKVFSPRQLSKVLADYRHGYLLAETLKKDFDNLVDFDRLESHLLEHEKAVLEKLYSFKPDISSEEMVRIFDNSIRLEWVDHIETKYPVLTIVSSQRLEQLENDLKEHIQEKHKVSQEILLLRLREQTYKNVSFNRLNNMVTYRDLKHQVSKRKKLWPVRKVLESFSEELFNLVPCWMASPESVSAIFPMEQMFDLVIFDEASQCFAERGIPAMYRGKQIVITGDEKQLSPNDLYLARWEQEEEMDLPDLEIDSLLNLGEKYLMQLQLSGHYRSQRPELIEFSNKSFYGGNLISLPENYYFNNNDSAISYIKVDGVWENNQNIREAEALVQLVEKIIKQDQLKSIGIVTFNFKQASCIQDILEERVLKNNLVIPEDLFVKNIENVQGDERDIIIFSVGYAPDKKGKMNMQFGSLNAEKGENRLNVAITRAREKVFVVSSILPAELKVEESKHIGPKLFKKYLEYAWMISSNKFSGYYDKKVEAETRNESHLSGVILKRTPSFVNLELSNEMPLADLTVRKDKKYLGLISTDDNIFYNSISAKDAHALAPLHMQEKNWRSKRFFSRQYWLDKEKFMEELNKFYYELNNM